MIRRLLTFQGASELRGGRPSILRADATCHLVWLAQWGAVPGNGQLGGSDVQWIGQIRDCKSASIPEFKLRFGRSLHSRDCWFGRKKHQSVGLANPWTTSFKSALYLQSKMLPV